MQGSIFCNLFKKKKIKRKKKIRGSFSALSPNHYKSHSLNVYTFLLKNAIKKYADKKMYAYF